MQPQEICLQAGITPKARPPDGPASARAPTLRPTLGAGPESTAGTAGGGVGLSGLSPGAGSGSAVGTGCVLTEGGPASAQNPVSQSSASVPPGSFSTRTKETHLPHVPEPLYRPGWALAVTRGTAAAPFLAGAPRQGDVCTMRKDPARQAGSPPHPGPRCALGKQRPHVEGTCPSLQKLARMGLGTDSAASPA